MAGDGYEFIRTSGSKTQFSWQLSGSKLYLSTKDDVFYFGDSNIPDDFRWAFSEIFMLVERRNFHQYIKIQADILAMAGSQKKIYYDRIVNVLVCDASQYYCKDLLVLYEKYLTEDEYKVVVELLEEYTGQIYTEEKSRVKIDETSIELDGSAIESDEKDELYLPGTWGKRGAIKQVEQVWMKFRRREKTKYI